MDKSLAQKGKFPSAQIRNALLARTVPTIVF